jgi:hypothetical protein
MAEDDGPSFHIRIPASCFPLRGRVLLISASDNSVSDGAGGGPARPPDVHVLAPIGLRPGQSVVAPRAAAIDFSDRLTVSPLWTAADAGDAADLEARLSGKSGKGGAAAGGAGGTPIVTKGAAAALLAIASKKGHKAVVLVVLRRFPLLVNSTLAEGRSALHIAAQEGHTRVIRALLELKADVHVMDSEGKTPIALAKTRGISRLLAASELEHAAKSHVMPKRLVDYCVVLRDSTTTTTTTTATTTAKAAATHTPGASAPRTPAAAPAGATKVSRAVLCRWPEQNHPVGVCARACVFTVMCSSCPFL